MRSIVVDQDRLLAEVSRRLQKPMTFPELYQWVNDGDYQWADGCDDKIGTDLLLDILNTMNFGRVRRGDFIDAIPKVHRYRNAGTYAWDGGKVIPLCYSDCDYGVPPFQVINEFPIHSWDDVNGHNSFVYADLRPYAGDVVQTTICDGYPLIVKHTFTGPDRLSANFSPNVLYTLLYISEESHADDADFGQILEHCFGEDVMYQHSWPDIDALQLGLDPNYTLYLVA